MITLHHLNKSRSKRIIWLLEELELEYRVIPYQRDALSFLAPESLKQAHPLGKAPVIELEGKTIAESGAITEYLISRFAAEELAPAKDSLEYIDYLQWLHFAESSGILPLLLKIFVAKDGCKTNFLEDYAQTEAVKILSYFDQALTDKRYLVSDKLTGADIMMSFIVEQLQMNGELETFSNIARYSRQLAKHSLWLKASQIEAELDKEIP